MEVNYIDLIHDFNSAVIYLYSDGKLYKRMIIYSYRDFIDLCYQFKMDLNKDHIVIRIYNTNRNILYLFGTQLYKIYDFNKLMKEVI